MYASATHVAGLEDVPVVGSRTSYEADHSGNKLDNEPGLKRDAGGYFPGDFRVSRVLPRHHVAD
jgi:hypothetical protein